MNRKHHAIYSDPPGAAAGAAPAGFVLAVEPLGHHSFQAVLARRLQHLFAAAGERLALERVHLQRNRQARPQRADQRRGDAALRRLRDPDLCIRQPERQCRPLLPDENDGSPPVLGDRGEDEGEESADLTI